jgi:hypothetical protein
MYEYEVVPVRTVRALEEDFDKVEDVGAIPLEDAIKLALDFFAADGWKLHTCHIGEGAILVFERVTKASAKKLMDAFAAGVVS